MSTIKTSTVWRCIDAQWVDTDPTCSVIALVLQSNGKEFCVVCSGPKGMKSNDFIPAVRAAAASMLAASGGDLSAVGASTLDEAKFDTGDQRAN
jgi:hypothetical protein